jgi:hypothetical protein
LPTRTTPTPSPPRRVPNTTMQNPTAAVTNETEPKAAIAVRSGVKVDETLRETVCQHWWWLCQCGRKFADWRALKTQALRLDIGNLPTSVSAAHAPLGLLCASHARTPTPAQYRRCTFLAHRAPEQQSRGFSCPLAVALDPVETKRGFRALVACQIGRLHPAVS